MKKLLVLTVTLGFMLGFTAMGYKPKCITNGQAVCYYLSNAASLEAIQTRLESQGNPRDAAIDIGIADAQAKAKYYSTLPANTIASPCIVSNQGDGTKPPVCP